MNIVANNIKRILEETGTKHKKAAELCGYNAQTFSAMLNGRKTIKTEDIIALCRGLNVEPNDLYRVSITSNKPA